MSTLEKIDVVQTKKDNVNLMHPKKNMIKTAIDDVDKSTVSRNEGLEDKMREANSTLEKIQVVVDNKKIIVNLVHPQKEVVKTAIDDFKKAFNIRIGSLNEKLEENKRECEKLSIEISDETENIRKCTGDLEKDLQNQKDANAVCQTNVSEKSEKDFIEGKKADEKKAQEAIDNLNHDNKVTENNIQELQKNITSLEADIISCSSRKEIFEKQLREVETRVYNFSDTMVVIDKHLVELIKDSEVKTKSIEEAVDNSFTFYEGEIAENTVKSVVDGNNSTGTTEPTPGKKTSSFLFPKCPFSFDIIDDPMQKHWSTVQTNEYQNKLEIHAKTQNSDIKLTRKQHDLLMRNVKSSQKQACPLTHKSTTAGSWCDVSASEVDISEFSMDELSAHVENLTAELRAL